MTPNYTPYLLPLRYGFATLKKRDYGKIIKSIPILKLKRGYTEKELGEKEEIYHKELDRKYGKVSSDD